MGALVWGWLLDRFVDLDRLFSGVVNSGLEGNGLASLLDMSTIAIYLTIVLARSWLVRDSVQRRSAF